MALLPVETTFFKQYSFCAKSIPAVTKRGQSKDPWKLPISLSRRSKHIAGNMHETWLFWRIYFAYRPNVMQWRVDRNYKFVKGIDKSRSVTIETITLKCNLILEMQQHLHHLTPHGFKMADWRCFLKMFQVHIKWMLLEGKLQTLSAMQTQGKKHEHFNHILNAMYQVPWTFTRKKNATSEKSFNLK